MDHIDELEGVYEEDLEVVEFKLVVMALVEVAVEEFEDMG